MLETLTVFNIFFGVAAFLYPLLAAVRFDRETALGRAVVCMFLGEAIAMFCTLIFAILAYTGWLNELNGFAQAGLRLSMFAVTIITSIHLTVVTKLILNGTIKIN